MMNARTATEVLVDGVGGDVIAVEAVERALIQFEAAQVRREIQRAIRRQQIDAGANQLGVIALDVEHAFGRLRIRERRWVEQDQVVAIGARRGVREPLLAVGADQPVMRRSRAFSSRLRSAQFR